MIKNFSDYSDDILFENLLNESILYFSPYFRAKLSSVSDKSEIAQILLNNEGEDLTSDITFIDFSSELGYLTFLPMQKAIDKITAVFPRATDGNIDIIYNQGTNDFIYDRDVSNNMRVGIYHGNKNQIKIGKFVKKVLGGISGGNKFSDHDIEIFVNLLKSIKDEPEDIVVVSGKDIKYWYNSNNYFSKSGSLGNSCMADKDFFDLYVNNPDVCQLVIMKSGNKLVARALLWKLHSCKPSGPEYFMDRIYYIKDYQLDQMQQYAESKGWAYKNDNRGDNVRFKNDFIPHPEMVVKVKPVEYETYPYMDTFRRYDAKNGYLYNDSKSGKNIKGYVLDSTHGQHRESRYKPNVFRRMMDFVRNESIENNN